MLVFRIKKLCEQKDVKELGREVKKSPQQMPGARREEN